MVNNKQYNPETITIYGVGLLGGSIGASLKKSGFSGRIIGLSSDNDLKTAKEMGVIDSGYPYSDLSEVIKQTELLILCAPIFAIIDVMEKLGTTELPKDLVVTDVGSTKKNIVEAAKKHLPIGIRFIGGHPMAGSEKSGPAASDPYLFRNAAYVLTPAECVEVQFVEEFADFLRKYLGCRIIVAEPETHDFAVAAISHLPHILACALVLCAQKQEKHAAGTLELAAGGFKDMTRIASAEYGMWHDIFSTNKDAIVSLIDSYINILDDMKTKIVDEALREDFETARRVRDSIVNFKKGID